jgi:uncharacterized alkaline shock family protein YloU
LDEKLGSVRISPHVLSTIARLATLGVPGVVRMCTDLSSGVDRLLKGKGGREGVHISVDDDAVSVFLYIVVQHHVNIYQVCREVQEAVARAITDMVGMPVLSVDVYVENVEHAPEHD